VARHRQNIPNSNLVFHFLPHNITPRTVEQYRPQNYTTTSSSSSPIMPFYMVKLINEIKKIAVPMTPTASAKTGSTSLEVFPSY